jgi:hypothetical protein
MDQGVKRRDNNRIKETRKRYYETHKNEIRAKQAAYNAANKQKIKQLAKDYYAGHKEQLKANSRTRYRTIKGRVVLEPLPHVDPVPEVALE